MTNYEIVGLGNPLLDICANVDQSVLTKYDLKLDNAILAESKHNDLYKELMELKGMELVAGGATQNSIRVAQWMLQKKEATCFVGCIGKDSYGEKLKHCASEDGVFGHYLEDDSTPTGTCAVCIVDGERSLVANLSAANNYKMDHLMLEETQKIIEGAKYFYSAGFHLTVCPDAMLSMGKHAAKENKVFSINLSAPFIMAVFKEPLMKLLPYCDIVFGNETEASEFGKIMDWGSDLNVIALKLSQMAKESGARCRTVVFTQGSAPTIVAQHGKVISFPVPELEQKSIVDTNGAGDAFVGGYLAMLAQDKSLEECIKAGNYAAQVVIQRSGCTFPEKCAFE